MKGTKLPLAIIAVITMTIDFRAEAFPKPQSDENNFTIVDGFAFDDGPARNIPISRPDESQIGQAFPTTVAPTTAVTQSPTVAQCIMDCLVTSEYNPVCGSDNVVYKNPGMLNCAQRCGKNVQAARFGPCTSRIRG